MGLPRHREIQPRCSPGTWAAVPCWGHERDSHRHDRVEGNRRRHLRRHGHVTRVGKPRTSGVMYAVQDRRIFVAVDSDSWKARQIHDGDEVSMTVTVPRGGVLPLLFPIPPATMTFNARATMYAADRASGRSLPS